MGEKGKGRRDPIFGSVIVACNGMCVVGIRWTRIRLGRYWIGKLDWGKLR